MPNPGPCFDKFLALEDARRDSEACWAAIDHQQFVLTAKTSIAIVGCEAAVLSPDPLSKERCAAGIGFALAGFVDFWDAMDRCNELDLDGKDAALDWLACYREHKAVLDARLQPVS